MRACLAASRAVLAVLYDPRSEALLRRMELWVLDPSLENLAQIRGCEHAQYTPPARCLEEARKAILSKTMGSDAAAGLPELTEAEARLLAQTLCERRGDPTFAQAELAPNPFSEEPGSLTWRVLSWPDWDPNHHFPMDLFQAQFELNLLRVVSDRVPLWESDVERRVARGIRCAASRIYADQGLTPESVRGAIREDCLPWVLGVRDPLETDLAERCRGIPT